MKYFTNIRTLDELKAAYRRLALKYHPDMGGSTEIMQEINSEHDALFEQLKRQHNASADEYHQTTETAEEFREILAVLLGLRSNFAGRGSGSAARRASTRTRSRRPVAAGAAAKRCGTGGTRRMRAAITAASAPWARSARSTAARYLTQTAASVLHITGLGRRRKPSPAVLRPPVKVRR